MGELARGNISDRPWGQTLGALGMRGLTGQLELFADGKVYTVAFQRGTVVAAHSPLVNDAAVRLALTGNLVTSTQVADITRRMATQPERDEVEFLAEIIRLPAEQAQRLRRRLVAQRAARTFSVERGEFVVKDTIALPVIAGAALDIRTVVYLGAKSNLSEQRLAVELAQMGVWFQIKPDTLPELAQYGFTDAEKPILKMLIEGANIAEVEATHHELGVRAIHAVAYALAACNACDRSITPRPSSRPSSPPPAQRQPASRSGSTMTPPAGIARAGSTPHTGGTRSGSTITPPAGVARSGSPTPGQRVHTPTAAPSVIRMPPSVTSASPDASPDTGPVRVSRISAPPPGAPIDQMVPRAGTTNQHRAASDTRAPSDGNRHRSDTGSNRYPSDTGSNRYPSDTGSNRYPSDTGSNRYPSDTGSNRYPSDTGSNRYPSDTGSNRYPSDTGGNRYPSDTGGNRYPSDTGGNRYPSDTGGNRYPSDTGGSPYPSADGLPRAPADAGPYPSADGLPRAPADAGSAGNRTPWSSGAHESRISDSDVRPPTGLPRMPGESGVRATPTGLPRMPSESGTRLPPTLSESGARLPPTSAGSGGRLTPTELSRMPSESGSRLTPTELSRMPSESGGRPTPMGVPHMPSESGGRPTPTGVPRMPSESGGRPTPTGVPRMPSESGGRPTPTGVPRMPSESGVRLTPTGVPRMPSESGVRLTPTGLPRMPSDAGVSGPPSRASELEIGRSQAGPPSRARDPAIGRSHTPAAQSRVSTDPAVSRVPTPAATSRTQTDPTIGRSPSPQGPSVGRAPSSPTVGRVPTGSAEGRVPTGPQMARTGTGPQVSRTGTGPQVSRTMSPSGGVPSAMNPAGTGSHRSVEGTAPPATRPVPPSIKRARRDSAALAEIEDLLTDKIPLLDRGADHFTLLGLPQDASPTDVRSAYFSLARKLHPDRLAAIGVFDEERRAQRLMAQVNLAFAVLNDPAKRDEYMKVLRRGGEAVAKAEDAKADELAMSVMRAEEAFKQGEMALRRDQIQQAIDAFAIAVELQPRESEYQAMLAWAQFAGATDKNAIAASVRKTLVRAAEDNDRSITAKFYLGRVERMLGREKEALAHFQEVLRMKPNHSEATSEARILEQRLRNKR